MAIFPADLLQGTLELSKKQPMVDRAYPLKRQD